MPAVGPRAGLRAAAVFVCRAKRKQVRIFRMTARATLRAFVLATLILQVFASASEAMICNACPAEAVAGCPSSSEAAAMCAPEPQCGSDSIPPTSQESGSKPCSFCPSCPGPCIKSPTVSVSPENRVQRIALSDIAVFYEAPSSVLLRPPIN